MNELEKPIQVRAGCGHLVMVGFDVPVPLRCEDCTDIEEMRTRFFNSRQARYVRTVESMLREVSVNSDCVCAM